MPKKLEDVFAQYDTHGGDPNVCWEWMGDWHGKNPRPRFRYGKSSRVAYRVVFELVYGPLKPGEVVRHTCDCGGHPIGCGNPHHMIRGSHQDNMDDMKERNRHGLSAYVVRAIRKLYEEGQSASAIAALYGIGESTVRDIVTKRTHAHIEESEE